MVEDRKSSRDEVQPRSVAGSDTVPWKNGARMVHRCSVCLLGSFDVIRSFLFTISSPSQLAKDCLALYPHVLKSCVPYFRLFETLCGVDMYRDCGLFTMCIIITYLICSAA